MEIKDVENLANLCRLAVSDAEKEHLLKDLKSILGYVEQIKEISQAESFSPEYVLKNVIREDKDPHEAGVYTKKLVSEMPESERNFLKVKQILDFESYKS